MHHELLADEMGGVLDKGKQVADTARPLVQHLVAGLGLGKDHQPGGPVDLGKDVPAGHHVAQERLRILRA